MSANAYEDFLRDIHPELLDQFRLFSEEKDIYKQFITFAHPEFKADFKKYTELYKIRWMSYVMIAMLIL